ncbi:CAZyme family GH17 [Penicillium roqueforti]|nr:CAZyme family GH17 [Penicillium roqueforti]KAI3109527.1 CAZyme family GH17 [Penicillium roqueforti]KAI3135138.1 CAZyme family GH17 [Penicillium roqueforti]KAI3236719.1 CAZyme family GH17 [Penicillium roqueforti]KAI3237504.1 CAZyme family GH17 [Penicillium roqueforti]
MDLQETQRILSEYLHELADLFHRVPGSAIFLRYVKSSYQDDPIRSAVELFLFLFAVRYLLAPKYSTKPGVVPLTEDEIDDLVDEWTPEPLVGDPTALEAMEVDKRTVIVGPVGPKSKLTNGRTVMNLGSFNFYNFNTNESLKEQAIQTLRAYGVGPCGPRGFYGTQDVHIKTEDDVASFLGTAACIIYSQAFSTISSVIPAFSKRGDIIVADKGVSFAIRKGIQISRSMVRWYEHNDMEDLERVLAKVTKEQARKPLTRRFIITEGLFASYGDMADLPKIIELRLKYKFRLILDETWSFGVLGRTGRGITEHQNVDAAEVDMIVGSLAGPLVAGGGFCAGSEEIVHHQRISAAAYTFSAALPALLSTTASATINILQNNPETVSQLREHTKAMRAQLDPRSDWVYCTSAPENPILVLVIKPEVVAAKRLTEDDQQFLLQDVVDECLANGVLITRLKTLEDNFQPKQVIPPALKVCVTTGLTKKETEKAGTIIRHAITKSPPGEPGCKMKRLTQSLVGLLLACGVCAEAGADKQPRANLAQPAYTKEVVVWVNEKGETISTETHYVQALTSALQENQPSISTPDTNGAPPHALSKNSNDHPVPAKGKPKNLPHHPHKHPKPAVSHSHQNQHPNANFGISYSPYKADRTCKNQEEVNQDLDRISSYSFIRIYGTDCDQTKTVTTAARRHNMQVFAGIYDLTNFPSSLDAFSEAITDPNGKKDWSIFHTIAVGNELVNGGTNSATDVAAAVQTARSILRAQGYTGPVVTVDTFSVHLDHPELCHVSDYCAANCHAFFDATQQPAGAGAYALEQARSISAGAGGKRTMITESGWPHAGDANGGAVPSKENQLAAVESLRRSFEKRRGDLVLFTAFDDLWKDDNMYTFNAEKFWGIHGGL